MSLRPDRSEYAEYYDRYVSLVPEGDIALTLERQFEESRELLDAVDPERETYRYAPGKWSVRQVVGHVIDTERVFAGRALWIARAPHVELPGMEQDDWAALSNAGDRPLGELLQEWAAVRADTVALVLGMDDDALRAEGVASGVGFTVRSFFWVIAGHELHHRGILRGVYGVGDGG